MMDTYTPVRTATNAPKPKFARPGANPTLATLELIRSALRKAGGPVSRNQLLERLASWGHSTSRQSLNAAIGFLAQDGSIVEGSKGLMWVPEASGPLLDAIRDGNRL